MDFTEYIKPELLILIPVLYVIGMAAVSYTHLDVYKRQGLIGTTGSDFLGNISYMQMVLQLSLIHIYVLLQKYRNGFYCLQLTKRCRKN